MLSRTKLASQAPNPRVRRVIQGQNQYYVIYDVNGRRVQVFDAQGQNIGPGVEHEDGVMDIAADALGVVAVFGESDEVHFARLNAAGQPASTPELIVPTSAPVEAVALADGADGFSVVYVEATANGDQIGNALLGADGEVLWRTRSVPVTAT